MSTRLRVGVIGLGRRWRRYRRALEALRKRVTVRAVCDQVARRAEAEARRLGCAAAAGPVDLLERDDVDAALLLGRQWFGLWPLEHACRVGKPVFCAVPLTADEEHADDLRRRVADAGLPVQAALAPAARRRRRGRPAGGLPGRAAGRPAGAAGLRGRLPRAGVAPGRPAKSRRGPARPDRLNGGPRTAPLRPTGLNGLPPGPPGN